MRSFNELSITSRTIIRIVEFADRWLPEIKKYEKCRGLSFPSVGKYKIEVWYAPRNYRIRPHTHNNEDIKLMLLFGNNVRFHRQKAGEFLSESYFATLKDIFKVFTINAGDCHSFDVSNWPLLFLNFEKWKCNPSSACEDLQYS